MKIIKNNFSRDELDESHTMVPIAAASLMTIIVYVVFLMRPFSCYYQHNPTTQVNPTQVNPTSGERK